MTGKQPDPLALADEVDEVAKTFPDMAEVSACIRTQHKQIAAYKLLTEAQEAQLSQHRAQADKYRETIATLQSERDANATLTAEIERLNAAATDSNLILERAQATNLEMLAAIQRKDALLQQALAALKRSYGYGTTLVDDSTSDAIESITKELSQ